MTTRNKIKRKAIDHGKNILIIGLNKLPCTLSDVLSKTEESSSIVKPYTMSARNSDKEVLNDETAKCTSKYEKLGNSPVNHPQHYCTGKYECIDVMLEVFGVEAVKTFCLLNAFKYNYRSNRKNGRQDIEKAVWYSNKYLELSKNEVEKC